jgi:hypothetical protein
VQQVRVLVMVQQVKVLLEQGMPMALKNTRQSWCSNNIHMTDT